MAGTDELISDVGEFGLIARIEGVLGQQSSARVAVGLGDDAAVVSTPRKHAVVSTDMLVEGRHFRRDWSSAADVGARAAAQNFIDVAVMGAAPSSMVVGLGVPGELPVAWVAELYSGLREAADAMGVAIVGGDVVRSEKVVISVTVLGDITAAKAVRRSGAAPGDVLAIAGRLGWAAAGQSILSRGFRTPRTLVDAHRRPEPPYEAAAAAAASGATSMIDVSDGLVADLGHVARASGVVISLDPALLEVAEPVAAAASAFSADPLVWILSGGEDHAVVATFPEGAELPAGFTVIGSVTAVSDESDPDAPGLDAPGVHVAGRVPRGIEGFDHFVN